MPLRQTTITEHEHEHEQGLDLDAGTRAVQRAVLQVSLLGGEPVRFTLAESPVLIGRVQEAQLQLDHFTVSRRHAEMVCDPFGRWWIRDLGSTNGTQIGGAQILEHVLTPGDRIGIGDYEIGFELERERGGPESVGYRAFDEDKPTVIRGLGELEHPRIAAGHLRTLLEFSRKLFDIETAEERRAALCELLVGGDFSATMACIVSSKPSSWNLLAGPFGPNRHYREGRPYISASVLQSVRSSGQAVLATNVAGQAASDTPAIEISMAREVMELWVVACPIVTRQEVIEVLYAYIPRDCGNAEWVNLYALAAEVYRQAETAAVARVAAHKHAVIERELDTARQIQRGLLPRKLGVAGLEIAVGFEPCKWVGGDYVDVIHLPDGRVLLAVADVCGKGLQAALVGSSLHTIVRASCDTTPALTDLVGRVNRHFCEWLPSHSFVTMVVALIDPATGRFECVNAGHPPPFIVDAHGTIRALQEAENTALGIDDVPFQAQTARLSPGAVLVMYTDGLTELRDESRTMLGEQQLGLLLSLICGDHPEGPADALSAALSASLERYRGGEAVEDDRTFLVARRT